MDAQELIRNRLQQRFLELQTKNAHYSVRAFAKRIQVPAGSLSLILLGKRKISLKLGMRIANALAMDPVEKEILTASFQKKKLSAKPAVSRADKMKNLKQLKLSADQFRIIRDWQHYAILNLLFVKGFKPDSQWIADALGIKESVAKESIQRLFDLGLLARAADGTWKRKHKQLRTPDGIKSISLQVAHIQELELARDAIQNLPIESRDNFSLTFPGKFVDLIKLKGIIREFSQKILDEACCDRDADDVFQFQIQLFPVSQVSKIKVSGGSHEV